MQKLAHTPTAARAADRTPRWALAAYRDTCPDTLLVCRCNKQGQHSNHHLCLHSQPCRDVLGHGKQCSSCAAINAKNEAQSVANARSRGTPPHSACAPGGFSSG